MNRTAGSGLCQMTKFGISDIEFRDSVAKGLVPCFTHAMYPIFKITPDISVSEVSIPWIEIIIISVQALFSTTPNSQSLCSQTHSHWLAEGTLTAM